MSKVVRAVVGIGLIVTGIFMGGTTWPLAVMALGGGIAASALQPKMNMPSYSEATAGRLNKTLEPEAFRKIAFGRTALATDTRYWEVYGSDQSNYDEVMALAGHAITSFDELHVEDERVTLDGAGNATGKYAGALSVKTALVGVSGTALTGIGTGTRWNASGGEAASMTGIAHMALKWKWSQEKLPRGFPTRITPVGKGAPVYDPRRDDTRGGDGDHRADDQSTWEHLPTDSNGIHIGRNPALQILHYLIGWRIENPDTGEQVLVHGMGIDPEDIDFDSFVTAANDCETEEYYSDCLLSTGDNHATNIGVLEQACAGKVSDAGGRYTLRIQVDDFGGSLVEFTDDDIVGECDWRPEMPLAQSSYNQIAGQFIDPEALYQLRPLPLVRDAVYEAADGEKTRTNVRLDAVQDGEQAQKLLRLRLNKSRRKGLFEAPFGWRAINVRVGQPVKLTLSRFGFDERYFRVRAQKVDPGGAVWMALESDGPDVYSGGPVLPVPPPGGGAGYDPISVPTPGADEWGGTGGSIGTPGGPQTPAITVNSGEGEHPSSITGILVYTCKDTDEGPWAFYAEYPPDTDSFRIDGLLASSTYYVRIIYRNAFGVLDQTASLILGPFDTGSLVANDATIPSGLIEDARDAINDRLEEADETLADAASRLAGLGATAAHNSLLNWLEDPLFRTGTAGFVAVEGTIMPMAGTPRGLEAFWNFSATGLQDTKVLRWPGRKPVGSQDAVQASVDIETTGSVSSVTLQAVWYDAAGDLLSTSDIYAGDTGRIGGVVAAPEDAAQVEIRMVPTVSEAGYGSVQIHRPKAAYALPGQTAADPFEDPDNETVSRIASLERTVAGMAEFIRSLQVETRRGRAGFRQNVTAISNEEQSRIDAVESLQTAYQLADSGLQTQINSRATITYVNTAVSNEAGARASAIATLEAEYQAADSALQTAINSRATITYVDDAIAGEEAARATAISQLRAEFEAADDVLGTAILARATITYVDDAVADEAGARATALTALEAAYQAADDDLQTDINSRATVTYVDTAVAGEASARASALAVIEAAYEAADDALQTQINSRATVTYVDEAVADEAGSRATAIAALEAAYEAADDNLQTQITARSTITYVDTAIAGEASTRASAISSLTSSFNDLDATVTTQASTLADIEGNLEAAYAFTLTAGDKVGGMVALNDGTTTSVNFAFDFFVIEGVERFTFDTETGTFGAPNLVVDTITAGSVTANSIESGQLGTRSAAYVDEHDFCTSTASTTDQTSHFNTLTLDTPAIPVKPGSQLTAKVGYEMSGRYNSYEYLFFRSRIQLRVTRSDDTVVTYTPTTWQESVHIHKTTSNVGGGPSVGNDYQVEEQYGKEIVFVLPTSGAPFVYGGEPFKKIALRLIIEAYSPQTSGSQCVFGSINSTKIKTYQKLQDVHAILEAAIDGPFVNVVQQTVSGSTTTSGGTDGAGSIPVIDWEAGAIVMP